jgi:hypothetical protein
MFINEVSFSWDYFIKVPNFWALADNLGQKNYELLGYFQLIYQHLKKMLGKWEEKKNIIKGRKTLVQGYFLSP